ncbi:MAG: hypothetical protein QM755_01320 [Luteolibacter sp.]
MSKACLLLLVPVFLHVARAEDVTRAWHLAVVPAAVRDAVAISELPTHSVFASKGDQLVDLSRELKAEETFGKGAWIAWNGTRRLLVVRGNRHTLAYADNVKFLWEQHLVGIELAWFQGIGPGELLPADAKAIHRKEIIITECSGTRTTGKWEPAEAGTLGEVEVGTAAFFDSNESSAEVQLTLDWKERRGREALSWSYAGSFVTAFQGGPERMLCQFVSPTGERWTITAKARDLLADGTPASESRRQEVDGKMMPAVYRAPESHADVLGKASVEGFALHVADFGVDGYFTEALFEAFERNHKPSSATIAGETRSSLERPGYCQDAILPDALKEYAPVSMWDLKPLLEASSIRFPEAKWIVYDPRLKRILVASTAPEAADGMALLANASCAPDQPNFTATFRGRLDGAVEPSTPVGAKFIGRFGGGAQLECWDEKETNLLSIRIAPNEGPEKGIMDTSYKVESNGVPGFPASKAEGRTGFALDAESPIQTNESGGR